MSDLEPLIISILYGCFVIYDQYGLRVVLFSPLTSSKLVILCTKVFIAVYFIHNNFHTFPEVIPCVYDVILSSVCSLLSSLVLSIIITAKHIINLFFQLIWTSLLNLCYDLWYFITFLNNFYNLSIKFLSPLFSYEYYLSKTIHLCHNTATSYYYSTQFIFHGTNNLFVSTYC